MNALFFLTVHKTKNKLLELLHKPVRLIVTLGFVLLLVMNFTLSQNSPMGERPLLEFRAIIFAFYIICFITEAKKGFQSGGTMFSLSDVNLLFMSPVRSVSILFHGMLSRLGSSLFMAFAFVYQFALLRSYYPVEADDMLTAVAGYAAVVFISQLSGMLIYFFTCGSPGKIKKAKAVFCCVITLFLAFCAARIIGNGKITVTELALAVTSFPMRFFPVAGWVFTAVDGIMLSDTLKILSGVFSCLFFTAAVFIILAFSKQGYYEDVLLSAEKNADKKAEVTPVTNVRIRESEKGLKKGRGASAFLYKHFLENRRTKSSLFSPSSFIYLVMIGVYGFVFDGDFAMLFSLSCMVSFLPVLSGRWLKELSMPYIYMIPGSHFKKLFYILPEMLPKIIAESVLQCILIGYLCHLGAVSVVFIIIARMSVSFVLVASALLMARIFREKEKNNVFIAMSVMPGMLFIIPSVICLIAALNFGFGFVIAFAAMAAVNAFVSLIVLFFARNLLKITD